MIIDIITNHISLGDLYAVQKLKAMKRRIIKEKFPSRRRKWNTSRLQLIGDRKNGRTHHFFSLADLLFTRLEVSGPFQRRSSFAISFVNLSIEGNHFVTFCLPFVSSYFHFLFTYFSVLLFAERINTKNGAKFDSDFLVKGFLYRSWPREGME